MVPTTYPTILAAQLRALVELRRLSLPTNTLEWAATLDLIHKTTLDISATINAIKIFNSRLPGDAFMRTINLVLPAEEALLRLRDAVSEEIVCARKECG